jgi:hypothetical protein
MAKKLTSLSGDEWRMAAQVVESDDAVKRLAPGKSRVVATHFLPPRRRGRRGGRHAVVGLYDYTHGRSVVAVVDLETGRVTDVTETAGQFQLNQEEREEAERLAGEDPRVQDFLAGRAMNPLTRLYFPGALPPGDRQHRFAIVFLRPSNRERRYAVVDLSEGAAVDVIGPESIRPQ